MGKIHISLIVFRAQDNKISICKCHVTGEKSLGGFNKLHIFCWFFLLDVTTCHVTPPMHSVLKIWKKWLWKYKDGTISKNIPVDSLRFWTNLRNILFTPLWVWIFLKTALECIAFSYYCHFHLSKCNVGGDI